MRFYAQKFSSVGGIQYFYSMKIKVKPIKTSNIMRARVYRNFTFKVYTEAGEFMTRSDNFFTVESQVTAILKDNINNGEYIEGCMSYTIKQESKDGKYSRPIERVYIRKNDDTAYIDMIPDFIDLQINEEVEATEEESK